MKMKHLIVLVMLLFAFSSHKGNGVVNPIFQWRTIDYAWKNREARDQALMSGDYVPQHNMPVGVARWKDKVFVTIPRWKKGVPSSLNYITIDGPRSPPLHPYPNWEDGFVSDSSPYVKSNATVVSTFRVHVDRCDRLWVVDNGDTDMANGAVQIADRAIVVFDLRTDTVLRRYTLPLHVLRDASLFTSLAVEVIDDSNCTEAYAYLTDMGTNALVVYNLLNDTSWRVEHPNFYYDPKAGIYRVGGIDFFWNDGISSVALSNIKKNGYPDLFLHPTSSTKQFKMSTKHLRSEYLSSGDISNGVEVVGDRGPKSQVTASDYDPKTNVLFFTLVSKDAFGCWNVDRPFLTLFAPMLMADATLLEFPNDIKVDHEGNIWVLSDRQSRFLYEAMDFSQVNFRILTAPIDKLIKGTTCEKISSLNFRTVTK